MHETYICSSTPLMILDEQCYKALFCRLANEVKTEAWKDLCSAFPLLSKFNKQKWLNAAYGFNVVDEENPKHPVSIDQLFTLNWPFAEL